MAKNWIVDSGGFEGQLPSSEGSEVEAGAEFLMFAGEAGSGGNYFSGDTRIVTQAGARALSELSGGRHVLLGGDGCWLVASVEFSGRRPLWRVNLSRNGVGGSVDACECNQWLLRMYTSTGSRYWGARPGLVSTPGLLPGDRLASCFPQRPAGRSVDVGGVRRGFVFGDGCKVSIGTTAANFCGDKDIAMLGYFDGIGNPPRSYSHLVRITGLPGDWKYIPDSGNSCSYLYGWLAGYFAADGSVDKTGRPTLASASAGHMEKVRVICDRIGVGTYGIRTRIRSGFGRPATPLYLLGIMRGDLDPEFFLIPAHRERFEAGRAAVERRGWKVASVESHGRLAEVYRVVGDGVTSFTLKDHILVPA